MTNRKTRMMLKIEERYSKDIVEVLTELYQKLGTQMAVAEELGVSYSLICHWQWRLGLSFEKEPTVRPIRQEPTTVSEMAEA